MERVGPSLGVCVCGRVSLEVADLWVNLVSARALSHGSLGKLHLLSFGGLFWEMNVSIPVPGLWQRFKGPEGKGSLNVSSKWAS